VVGCGLGPRKAWRQIKTLYARVMDRGDHEIDRLSGLEKLVLALAGPWLLIVFFFFSIFDSLLNLSLLATALLLYPFLRLLSAQTLELARKLGPDAQRRPRISFKDGREVALLGFALGMAFTTATAVLPAIPAVRATVGDELAIVEGLAVLAGPLLGFAVAALALRRSPRLMAAMVFLRQGFILVPLFLFRLPFRLFRRVSRWLAAGRGLKRSAVSAQQ